MHYKMGILCGFQSQEFVNLRKLGDSLLTRSSKISDLIGQIESESGSDGPDMERVKKFTPQFHDQRTPLLTNIGFICFVQWEFSYSSFMMCPGQFRLWRMLPPFWKISMKLSRLWRWRWNPWQPSKMVLHLRLKSPGQGASANST